MTVLSPSCLVALITMSLVVKATPTKDIGESALVYFKPYNPLYNLDVVDRSRSCQIQPKVN